MKNKRAGRRLLWGLLVAGAVALLVFPAVFRPVREAVSGILTPLDATIAAITEPVENWLSGGKRDGKSAAEWQKQANRLEKEAAECETLRRQAAWYRSFLHIRIAHPDFRYTEAAVLSADAAGGVITLGAGTLAGVRPGNAVIAAEGLVGTVIEADGRWCRVRTVLHEQVQISAMTGTEPATGLTGGNAALAARGQFLLRLIPRECAIRTGDRIVTSGIGGGFPAELALGTVESVSFSQDGISKEAVVSAAVAVRRLSKVLIIIDTGGDTP